MPAVSNFIPFINSLFHWSEYSFGINLNSAVFCFLILFTLFIVAHYSKKYLSGEEGEGRFWLLFLAFSIGILFSCFSVNLKSFYIGWEIVGLTSFFLISFYQANARSVENSLIALSNYKMCDIFFVLAIFMQDSNNYSITGFCLITATLAKSAQVPFSSWLYRSLEGPTPSSTLFYGGLSLHLGAFLLLQFHPLWSFSPYLKIYLGIIGIISAVFGFLVGLSRSDLKTSFAYASISQIGLIYLELAFGLYHLALWHIVGHNLLRTWNYLRGMSFFEDFFKTEYHEAKNYSSIQLILKPFSKMYFHALNGFYLDSIFLLIRKWSLIVFTLLSFLFIWLQDYSQQLAFLYIFIGLFIGSFIFLNQSISKTTFYFGLIVSQLCLILSLHYFYESTYEKAYSFIVVIGLVLMTFALFPAFKIWRNQLDVRNKRNFLSLRRKHSVRHVIFLVSAIIITGAPGTLQYFIQEDLFVEIWTHSHLFLTLVLVCLTLNTVHTFNIGQKVFLGSKVH